MPLIGEIKLLPYEESPRGWMPCSGQTLHINEHPKLYMILGTKFGKEGDLGFRLPDMRGDAKPGFRYCIAVEGDIPALSGISQSETPAQKERSGQ